MKKLLVALVLGLFSVQALAVDIPLVTKLKAGGAKVTQLRVPFDDPEGWLSYICFREEGSPKVQCMSFGEGGRVVMYSVVLKELDT